MRKLKVYLETSVLSHLDQQDAPDKMNDTLVLWDEIKQGLYDVYISDVVIDEITSNAELKRARLFEYLTEIEYTLIDVNNEIRAYANKIVEAGILSNKHYNDCLHIASAVVNDCQLLLSWNFRHMVKIKTINGVRSISAALGYHGIDIYQPSALIGGR
ncbi:MAG: PIN domain-containing protein [Defluviitaleaceae bacterium]|nr:PIN domain-containing protein [Defluviitaleaceae bacterium]